QALAPGRIGAALEGLAPRSPEYAQLRSALEHYDRIVEAGGWARLPAGSALRPGAVGAAVAELRTRLAREVALAPEPANQFDDSLYLAVRSFQRSRGLDDDGV